MKKLILTSGVILAIAGQSAMAAPQSSTSGQQKLQSVVRAALDGVAPIEVPAEAAKVVLQANERDRAEVAVATVKYVGEHNPNAVIQTVSAISKNEPSLAPALVSAIIDQNPKLAERAAVAASQAAPDKAHRVAATAAKKSPKEAVKIGTSVAEVVPGRSAMVRLFVVSEVPEASSLATSSSISTGSISFGQNGGGGGQTSTGPGFSGPVLRPVGGNPNASGKQTVDPVTQENLIAIMDAVEAGQTPERAVSGLYNQKADELRGQGRPGLAARMESLGEDFALLAQANRELDTQAPGNPDAPKQQRTQENVQDAVATLTQINELTANVTAENEGEVSDAFQAVQQAVGLERQNKEIVVRKARGNFQLRQAIQLQRQLKRTENAEAREALQNELQQQRQQLSADEQGLLDQAENDEARGQVISGIAKSIVDAVKLALEEETSVKDAVQEKVDEIRQYASP